MMSKKSLFSVFVLSFLALGFAKAQNIQFEDPNLKAWLLSASPDNEIIARDVNGNTVAIDTNGDGEISYEEALNIYGLSIWSGTYISNGQAYVLGNIKSLEGIEYFTNLIALDLEGLNLEVNITGAQFPHLIVLTCPNAAKNITISDLPELRMLNCGSSDTLVVNVSLSNLPKIDELNMSRENVTITNLPNLETLRTIHTNTLVLSEVPELQYLMVDYSQLKTLDLSNVPNLTYLTCNNSTLQNVNVSKNIKLRSLGVMSVSGIETLDISKNTNLQTLSLYNSTGIKTLDVSKNTNLQSLYLSYTGIKTLDVSNNKNLTGLDLYYCSGLTSLYMKNGVKKIFAPDYYWRYNLIGTNLNYVCCDEGEIDDVKTCMQNLAANNSLTDGWQFSNLTITSDCEPYGLGTEDLSPQAKIALYPNPVKEVLYFSASGKVAKAEIYDLNGRLIKTAAVSNNSVNVSSLSKGVYFIILHTDKGTVKEKFMKN